MAQDYPNKPIKFIVPLTPGSGADIAGRIVAKHLTDIWKQPIVVENRPGAGGQIGTQAVIRSEPDGYTLLVQSASHAANPAIYKKLPYDPLKELVDVSILGVTPYLMVTAKGGEYSNLKALIDVAKSKPAHSLQRFPRSYSRYYFWPYSFLHGAYQYSNRPNERRKTFCIRCEHQ